MRIIAGQLRGKSMVAPEGMQTRPTSDRARESLFNILNSILLKQGLSWSDIIFADVFAGSGAIGIEALSRGAKDVYFMENDKKALDCIKKNIGHLSHAHLLASDALNPPTCKPVTILFMDAPYGKGLWQEALVAFEREGWIDGKTLIIIETDKKLKEVLPDGYTLLQERSAGRNTFLFTRKES